MKAIAEEMPADAVERLMEETAEAHEYQQRVAQALGARCSPHNLEPYTLHL